MSDELVVHFNNCRNQNHVEMYGKGAFFDLYADYESREPIARLVRGQICIVASYADDGSVQFDWYAFKSEKEFVDKDDQLVRVFYGNLLRREILSKAMAVQSKRYSAFFNRVGNFKRPSMAYGYLPAKSIPRARKKLASRN